jgi:hypothetical protein
MPTALTFTDPDSNVLNLNDDTNFVLRAIRGTGSPPLLQQAVRTPLQDGETYIRTLLEPRFIVLQLRLRGSSLANLQTRRRSLLTAFNPKLGVGLLKYKPDSAGQEYAIDCILERELPMNERLGTLMDRATVSLRCPDPTWYDPTQNTPTHTVTPTALAFPIEFPIQFGPKFDSTVINNIGDVQTWPVISNDDGAFDGVKIANTTTGKYLNFPTLSVASGETLIVDMGAKTAELDGISVVNKLTPDSQFWSLAKGNNTVVITMQRMTTDPVAWSIDWYKRFLGA